ncbi:fasciclin domain-containing protein [Microbulbifer yueqingensis]|uniref:Uncaracterized surface protein containing fasciclin (FAS1) repeats n=1 Tax=Microbulbifer yueqingensis TaxID=658219 RepID=A0A1G9EXA0_9GAMM|nr:fasciclin domain-containing protein [Microbulbifer yueqingensis]SDK80731.1 Uncaracterized surface protein containing fasciclin (FAS1) repeats [Microbulbifer yueqingensis]
MRTFKQLLSRFMWAPLVLAALYCGSLQADPNKTIAENAYKAESLSVLVEAIKAAGLVDTLNSEGPFTVFAPTDDAFAALPQGKVEELMKPENQQKLQKILGYHVVPGKATAEVVMEMIKKGGGHATVDTVQGEKLTLRADGGKVTVTDARGNTATVLQADLMSSNGVVHVINGVLMPTKK